MFHLLLLTHRALVKCPFLILIIINCHEHHDQKSHLVLFRDFALGAGEDSDHSSVTIPEDDNNDGDNHGDHGDDDDYHYECDYDDPDDQKRKDCIPGGRVEGSVTILGENIMRTALQLSLFFC